MEIPMLDAVGTVLSTMVMFVILVSVAGTLTPRRHQSVVLGLIAGLWVGVATAATAAGLFGKGTIGAIILLILFASPLIAAALVASFSRGARAAMLAFPMPVLIGLNFFRVLGVMFLFLVAARRLGGPFPYEAGWGDIITGVFALPVAWIATRSPNAKGWIAAWNVFGTLDLVVAVTLGVISQNGSPAQLILAGAGSDAIAHLPWALIPTVLVPFFLITHATVFAQLRKR
jgi:hypothetical protein